MLSKVVLVISMGIKKLDSKGYSEL